MVKCLVHVLVNIRVYSAATPQYCYFAPKTYAVEFATTVSDASVLPPPAVIAHDHKYREFTPPDQAVTVTEWFVVVVFVVNIGIGQI
jgi:hypothetical protein